MNQALAQDLTSGQLLSTLTWEDNQKENFFLKPILRPIFRQKWQNFNRNRIIKNEFVFNSFCHKKSSQILLIFPPTPPAFKRLSTHAEHIPSSSCRGFIIFSRPSRQQNRDFLATNPQCQRRQQAWAKTLEPGKIWENNGCLTLHT